MDISDLSELIPFYPSISQHRLAKRKPHLTTVTALCKGMMGWIGEARAVDGVWLHCSKALDTSSHSILRKHGPEAQPGWVENWLPDRA